MSAETDRKAVAAAMDAFAAALNRGDFEGAVGMMTDDARYWPDASPEMSGKASALAAYARLEPYRVHAAFSTEEILVGGDLALAIGREHFRLEPKAGGDALTIDGRRGYSVWRRQPDGSWKNCRGMTNWDAPRPPAGK